MTIQTHGIERWQRLLERCRDIDPLPTAVVHPCDRPSLESALVAARTGLVAPVFVAPRARLERLAAECGAALDGVELVDVPHSHAAAAKGTELARAGRVAALMKEACTPTSCCRRCSTSAPGCGPDVG